MFYFRTDQMEQIKKKAFWGQYTLFCVNQSIFKTKTLSSLTATFAKECADKTK